MPEPIPPGAALAALRKREQRTCQECGGPFEGYANQKYCCRRCTNRAGQKAHRQRQKEQQP